MGMQYHVLASGSAGNASLVQVDGFGVLLDFGLRPRALGQRLRAVGAGWADIHAVLLTHIHSDHWQPHTLAEFLTRRIPVYCHPDHVRSMGRTCPAFVEMQAAGLIRHYEIGEPWGLHAGCECRAFEVSHDGGATCGFRFEGPPGMFGRWALAYASDLGCWDEATVAQLTDVDVLALEFNHDVALQRGSGRPYFLIRRVLGDHGHLSNVQASQLLDRVMGRSEPGRLRHLVQLHLSGDCNTPDLAQAAAQAVRHPSRDEYQIHTARQDVAGPSLKFVPGKARRRAARLARERAFTQGVLPGWD